MATDKTDKKSEKKAKSEDGAASSGAAKKAGAGKSGSGKGGEGKKKRGAADTGITVAAAGETRITPEKTPRLELFYKQTVVPALVKKLSLKSAMQVPRLKRIVVNCGVKESVGNPKVIDHVVADIAAITGQRPVITRARKAIATFKLRKGLPIGVCVTLRRARMYEFLDRLIHITLPRVRDFRGIPTKSFDGRGNYSLGLREQIIFPEISYDKVDQMRGMTVTIETSAKTDAHGRELLAELGMPFKK